MPSSALAYSSRKQAPGSILHPATLPALLAVHCNLFRISELPLFSSDGIQNEGAAAGLARRPLLRRRTILFLAAEEAVCDQRVAALPEPVFTRHRRPLLENAPQFVSNQTHTLSTCRWNFVAFPLPETAGCGGNRFLQKRTERRERSNAALVHFCSTSCARQAFSVFSGPLSSSLFSGLYSFAFHGHEPSSIASMRVGCSMLPCRLVAQLQTFEERTRRIHINVNACTHTCIRQRIHGAGEAVRVSNVAVSLLSAELRTVTAIVLPSMKFFPVTPLLLQFLYAPLRRGRGERLPLRSGVRHQLAAVVSCLLAGVNIRSRTSRQHASQIFVLVGRFTMARIMLTGETHTCPCSFDAARAASGRTVREIIQKEGDARCGRSASSSSLFVEVLDKGTTRYRRGHDIFACLPFIFAILSVVATKLPSPGTWAWFFPLRELRNGVVSTPSSSLSSSHSFWLSVLYCCSRNAVACFWRPLRDAVASWICIMASSGETRIALLSGSAHAFLPRSCFVHARQARRQRKEHVEHTGASLSSVSISVRACAGCAVIFLSVTLNLLPHGDAPLQQFVRRHHHVFSLVFLSRWILLPRPPGKLILTPRPCYPCKAVDVFARTWKSIQQCTDCAHKQLLGKKPLQCAWGMKNTTMHDRGRGTTSLQSSHSEAFAYVCAPATQEKRSSAAVAADPDGCTLKKRRAMRGRLYFGAAAAAAKRRPRCYRDICSVRLEKDQVDKKTHFYSALCCVIFQTPKMDFRCQIDSTVSVVVALLIVLHSPGASFAWFASASSFVAPWRGMTCVAAACFFFLVSLCLYLIYIVPTSPRRCPQLLRSLCPSVLHWPFVLVTFPFSLCPSQLPPLGSGTQSGILGSPSVSGASSCVLDGRVSRKIFVGRRRGNGRLRCMNVHGTFTSLCPPVSDDVSACYFGSSRRVLVSSCDFRDSPFLLKCSCTCDCITPCRRSAAFFRSLRYMLCIFGCFTHAAGKLYACIVVLPCVFCTTGDFVPRCHSLTCGQSAAVGLVSRQFVSAIRFFLICLSGDIGNVFVLATTAVLPSVCHSFWSSANNPVAAPAARLPVAAAAGGRVAGGATGWCAVPTGAHVALPTTQDAVRASFVSASRCDVCFPLDTTPAAAEEAAGTRKRGLAASLFRAVLYYAGLAASLFRALFCYALTAEGGFPWRSSSSAANCFARVWETPSMMCPRSQSRSGTFPILLARTATAAYHVLLLPCGLSSVSFLCILSRFPMAGPFFIQSLLRPLSSVAILSPRARPRCCRSFVSCSGVLLLLLLLLSWILSSAEFTVVSDVDENIFLDLLGGLPEQQDSLLVRMSPGRKFSILNLDKQRFDVLPASFHTEAFQIIFGTVGDKKSLSNPLACDRSLPRVRYSAYFFFASPLADFWEQVPAGRTPISRAKRGGDIPASPFDIYRFSWPRGYQAVSLGTGLCIQVVEKQLSPKHILNVMFLAASASSASERLSAVPNVSLWTAVSLLVALLPLL